MRLIVRLLVIPVIALSLGLSLSVFNVAAAGAMLAYERVAFPSTCEMTRAFGARTPFCDLATGSATIDAEVSGLLRESEPFRVWGAVGAATAAILWLCFALLSLTSGPSDDLRRRAPRRAALPLASSEDDERVGFAPGAF